MTRQQGMDAVELLTADHDKVKRLFDQFDSSQDKGVLHQIFQELEVHASLEEEIFYPAVRDHIDPKVLGAEEDGEDFMAVSYEEHAAVKALIEELRRMDFNAAQFRDRCTELKEDVLDHASAEENVLFPVAKMRLDVEELGQRMAKRKDELLGALAE